MAHLAREGSGLPELRVLARAVWDIDGWLRLHFRYRGESEEVIRSVPVMLASLRTKGFFEGDCDDVSVFAAALFAARGVPVRYVAIRYGGGAEFAHVFIEYAHRGCWRRVDPTVRRGLIHQEDERMVLDV